MNKKIIKIIKKNKSKIVSLTAYSKNIAKILDKYCDIVLVETRWQMFYMDLKIHIKSLLQNIIQHASSVKKGIIKSLLVVDMPKGTYKNKNISKKNAKLIMKKLDVML